MFRNCLNAALRDFERSRLLAAISIGGLAIGLTAILVVGLMEFSVFNYDSFLLSHDRVYFAFFDAHDQHGDQIDPVTPHELADYFRQFPEVELAARASGALLDQGVTVSVRQGKIEAPERLDWADPDFFRIYRAPALYGDLDTALDRPDGAVVNLSTARKFFGRDNVIGQTLEIDRAHVFIIRAVIGDQPVNATFRAGLFLSGRASNSAMSMDIGKSGMSLDKGFSPDMFTLVRLRPGASIESVNKRASTLVSRFAAPPFRADVNFVPLRIAFFTIAGRTTVGARLLVLAAVALVTLALSCVNFVNLSIVRSAQRAVEVAMRKTTGAGRAALMVQFLGESVLQAFLALVIASAIVEWTRPSLEAFSGGAAVPNYWHDPELLLAVVGTTVLIGIAAGLYPALVLSGFRPASVLKGKITTSLNRGGLRAALVAFQFAAMIVFLIASGVLLEQNEFLRNDPQRVPIDNTLLMVVPTCGTALETETTFLPGVRAVTCSSTAVLDDGPATVGAKRRDGRIIPMEFAPVGLNFFEFYGLKPLAGRFFRPNNGDEATDKLMRVVLDETAVRQLGFGTPEAAIGQSVDYQNAHRTIIGVVRNFFLFTPTQGQPQPMMYSLGMRGGPFSYAMHVKISSDQIPQTQAAIETLSRRSGALAPPNQMFLDQLISLTEQEALRMGQLFAFFAGVAMVLGCLGLFGISLLTAQRRTKEIGVRKAMGATSRDIVQLLLWQFARPVLWANVLAWPIALYAMSKWLSGFAYHVTLDWRIFIGATLVTLLVALLTVAMQSIAAARAVPARALRYE